MTGASRPVSSYSAMGLFVAALPDVERLTGDSVVAARHGHISGHFIGMAEDRQTLLHLSINLCFGHLRIWAPEVSSGSFSSGRSSGNYRPGRGAEQWQLQAGSTSGLWCWALQVPRGSFSSSGRAIRRAFRIGGPPRWRRRLGCSRPARLLRSGGKRSRDQRG